MMLAFAASCDGGDPAVDPGNNGGDPEPVVNGVSFVLDKIVSTRVVDDLFDVGDLIGVQAYDAAGELYEYNDTYYYNSEEKNFTSSDPIAAEESNTSLSYVATYPALDENTKVWKAYADQSSDIKYELSDLLAAYVPATSSLAPSLTFYHAMSRVKINITVTKDGKPYDYSSVKFNASLSQGLDLDSQEFAAVEGVAPSEITPRQAGDDSYIAVVASQSVATSDFASLLFDDEIIAMELEDIDELVFEAGVSYTYDWSIVEYEGLLEQTLVLVDTDIDNWGPGGDIDQDIEAAITMDRKYDGQHIALSEEMISVGITRNTDDSKLATVTWSSSDENVATVDENGAVSLHNFGEVTISAECLGFVDQISFDVPGGLFREMYNTEKKIYNITSAERPKLDSYIYGINANTKVWDSENECLKVTCSANGSTTKSCTVDGLGHTLKRYERADFWCYNVKALTFNPHTYPYLVYHLDDNTIKNDVVYQEFMMNYSSLSNNASNVKPILKSGDGYANLYDCQVRHFSDNSLMVIFDMSKIITLNEELGDGPADYLTIGVADMNYFMYGYTEDATVGETLYPAMPASITWNLYSIQTFASMNDIDAYASSLGLSNK